MNEIPQAMIDDAMRFITDYYSHASKNQYITEESLVFNRICDEDEARHLVDVLVSRGHIAYGPSKYRDEDHIQLLNHSYFEDKMDEKQKERKEALRFWIEILKDVLIFAAGLFVEGRFGIFRNIFR